jgi:hypothetical protein
MLGTMSESVPRIPQGSYSEKRSTRCNPLWCFPKKEHIVRNMMKYRDKH